MPAQILLGLVGVTLIGFGASTLAQPGHDYVSKVGEVKISTEAVNQAVRNMQHSGGTPSRQEVYQSLIEQAYLQQGGMDLGAVASLEQIKWVIAHEPSFQENGAFSESRYQNFLRQSGISEAELIEDLRARLAIQTVMNLTTNGVMVSDAQARQMLVAYQAERQVRVAEFLPQQFAAEVKTDDAALKTYFEANKQKYEQAQALKFQYIVLTAKDLGAKQSVSEDEIKQAYEQLPHDASQPRPELAAVKEALEADIRLRKGQQALAAEREKLADLAFNHPDELNTAAKALGVAVEANNEWMTREMAQAGMMPEALQNALFSDDVLVKKHNSEPVTVGNDTVWVVRATEVRPQQAGEFEPLKEQIRADYVAAESLKKAQEAADAALKAGSKAQGVTWSPVTPLTSQQVQAFSAGDIQAIIKARPQEGQPAYALINRDQVPLLVEVQSVKEPENLAQALPAAKQQLAQITAVNTLEAFMQQMRARYKIEQGAQRLETAE
ncbi:peptidyl-prolyl cis-trans isomerase D [Neisseria sp. HSC-16F19]|nr:peptidyl-prolyl cis-trans isomerase D [Neisseria sp. HSC-16F19]